MAQSVGRAVAFEARDPRFESNHRQFILIPILKDENKERDQKGHLKKTCIITSTPSAEMPTYIF